jgi:hypothetical protein
MSSFTQAMRGGGGPDVVIQHRKSSGQRGQSAQGGVLHRIELNTLLVDKSENVSYFNMGIVTFNEFGYLRYRVPTYGIGRTSSVLSGDTYSTLDNEIIATSIISFNTTTYLHGEGYVAANRKRAIWCKPEHSNSDAFGVPHNKGFEVYGIIEWWRA